jgi:hypothetical protein
VAKPTLKNVAVSAEPMPLLCFGTQLITLLMFGEAKRPRTYLIFRHASFQTCTGRS